MFLTVCIWHWVVHNSPDQPIGLPIAVLRMTRGRWSCRGRENLRFVILRTYGDAPVQTP